MYFLFFGECIFLFHAGRLTILMMKLRFCNEIPVQGQAISMHEPDYNFSCHTDGTMLEQLLIGFFYLLDEAGCFQLLRLPMMNRKRGGHALSIIYFSHWESC